MHINALDSLLEDIKHAFTEIKEEDFQKMIQILHHNHRIFITGMGRSLLVGKMFAVRLLQMKYRVFIIGDPLSPSIKEGDIVLAISGSGETHFTRYAAEKAKSFGAFVISITGNRNSSLGKISDLCIEIPVKTKKEIAESKLLLGSEFEISALIFLDLVAYRLKQEKHLKEEEIESEHANIE